MAKTETGAQGARYAHVTGWGRYVPAQALTNADLEKMVDTNDEWIATRTGIRERRVAAAHETTASMGAVAGLRAIRTAGLDPDAIHPILLAPPPCRARARGGGGPRRPPRRVVPWGSS